MMRVCRCENTMTGQGSVSGGFQQSSGADKAGSDACTGRAAAAEGVHTPRESSLKNWAATPPTAVATASLHWMLRVWEE